MRRKPTETTLKMLDTLNASLERMKAEAKSKGGRNAHIRKNATEICQIEGLECWVSPSPGMANGYGGLNGYAVFPKRPVLESGYSGVLTYVPVHGGITYAEEDEIGMVYGFDTGHFDSDSKPRYDPAWIKKQLAVMIQGIRVAAEVEQEYLTTTDNEVKAQLCDRILKVQPEEWQNLGVMINVLFGQL